MKPIWGTKSAKLLNAEFLNEHKHNLNYILHGTRMLHLLDSKHQENAIKLVTCLDPEGIEEATLQVS